MNNQREIKFRAWDKEKKRIVEIEITEMDGGLFPIKGDWDNTIRPFEDENIILMQFTGLKDKNGKEIWEGDILELNDYPNHQVIVEWELIKNGWNFGSVEEWKVIGNIYENKELLK